MTFRPSYQARVLNGDFALAAKLTSASLPLAVDMLDTTALADTAKRFIAGQGESTFAVEGFIDVETAADNAAWSTAQPLTYGPVGLALSERVIMVDALRSTYELGSAVAGVSSFSLEGTTDGVTNFGKSLHDLTAETATAAGSAVDYTDVSSSGGGVGHLHVTAFSGFSSLDVIIEDSADGSTGWATIATFTQVTGLTSQRLSVAGTVRRYVRPSWIKVGTGSATFHVAWARR